MAGTSLNTTGPNREKTATRQAALRVRLPLGWTPAAALVIFLLFLGAGEAVARTSTFQDWFIAPGVGSRHRQFEVQLGRLKKVAAQRGGIDCIFLGNSMTWLGFDPIAFYSAFQASTGKELVCFNFGVDALSPAAAGPLAQILVEDFQPDLLIYGTDPRDFAVPLDSEDTTVLLETGWIQFRQGKFSLEGWLYEHSALYRYRFALRELLYFRFDQNLESWDTRTTRSMRYGFLPVTRVKYDVSLPPDPEDPSFHIQYYYQLLSNYQMLPENLAGFRQVLDQREKGVQVIVVEMPTPPAYIHFFTNRERDYQTFRGQVAGILEEEQVPFLHNDQEEITRSIYWIDYSHMTENGALVFSNWLGQALGERYQAGSLQSPAAEPANSGTGRP